MGGLFVFRAHGLLALRCQFSPEHLADGEVFGEMALLIVHDVDAVDVLEVQQAVEDAVLKLHAVEDADLAVEV